MWAAVAVIPVTVTLAVTAQSAPTATIALPAAPVFTGGTSWEPERDTRSPLDARGVGLLSIVPQPARSAPATSAASMPPCRVVFICVLLVDRGSLLETNSGGGSFIA